MTLNTTKQYNVNAAAGGKFIGKLSTANGGDFDVAYTSATTMTFSNYPDGVTALHADDIELVRQIDTDGGVIAVYSRDDNAISISGDVLTVSGAGFNSTDSFVVQTNIGIAPSYGHYTSVEALVSTTNLGITGTCSTGGAASATVIQDDTNGTEFTTANVAVGFLAYNEEEDVAVAVSSVDSVLLATTATVTDWDADTYWLPECERYEIDAVGYNHLTVHTQLATTGVGNSAFVKIYATLIAAADTTDDTDWVDISTDVFGATSVTCAGDTGTQEGIYFIDNSTPVLKYMIKVVGEINDNGAGAIAANAFDVYIKKSS